MRVLNRPLGFLLAAFLLVASVILIVEVVADAIKAQPVLVHWHTWYHWARRTRWKEGVVRFWAIVLLVAGAALLVLQLKPRRAPRLRVTSSDEATDAAITRRGLAGAARNAATGIDGITSAAVTVTRRKVAVRAGALAYGRDGARALSGPVTDAVTASVHGLQLRHEPRVSVRVTPRRR